MKTFKMLDISTAYISFEDSKTLEHAKDLGFTCAEYKEGFFINITNFSNPECLEQIKKNNEFSPEFFKVIEKAQEEGCVFINFDRDGEEYEEFEKFNW